MTDQKEGKGSEGIDQNNLFRKMEEIQKSQKQNPADPNSSRRESALHDCHDLSISSILSDYSKLLGHNSSSSFLVHVDDDISKKPSSNTNTAQIGSGSHQNQNSSLRRNKSNVQQQTTESKLTTTTATYLKTTVETGRSAQGFGQFGGSQQSINASSAALNAEAERQIIGDVTADSWDAFDMIMDKSVPPKDWEIHEFEEFQNQKNQSIISLPPEVETSFECFDDEAVKRLLEKDEQDRGQFLASENATFSSATPTPGNDPLSMTAYFQGGNSSFPVDNRANDSTMLDQNETWSRGNDGGTFEESVDNNNSILNDITVTPSSPNQNTQNRNSSFINTINSLPDSMMEEETPRAAKFLDNKTKDLAKYLMAGDASSMGKDAIMEYVLEVCRRKSLAPDGTFAAPASPIPNNKEVGKSSLSLDDTPIPSSHNPQIPKSAPGILKNNGPKNAKPAMPPSKPPRQDAPKMKPLLQKSDSVFELLEQPSTNFVKNCDRVVSFQDCPQVDARKRLNGFYEPPCSGCIRTDAQTSTTAIENDPVKVTDATSTTIENEKSILVSEPGRATELDDSKITDFDDFKRQLFSTKNSISKHRNPIANSTKNGSLPLEQSAFYVGPLIDKKEAEGRENAHRRSAEILRKQAEQQKQQTQASSNKHARQSPPEKLVSSRRDAVGNRISKSVPIPEFKEPPTPQQQNRNHSTPIGNESISAQMRRTLNDSVFESNSSTARIRNKNPPIPENNDSRESESSYSSMSTVVSRKGRHSIQEGSRAVPEIQRPKPVRSNHAGSESSETSRLSATESKVRKHGTTESMIPRSKDFKSGARPGSDKSKSPTTTAVPQHASSLAQQKNQLPIVGNHLEIERETSKVRARSAEGFVDHPSSAISSCDAAAGHTRHSSASNIFGPPPPQGMPSGYGPPGQPYGFPLSIHIHLPQMSNYGMPYQSYQSGFTTMEQPQSFLAPGAPPPSNGCCNNCQHPPPSK